MKEILQKDSFEMIDEKGKIVAYIHFPLDENNIPCITKTFVDDSLRGKGVAKYLMQKMVEIASTNNILFTATCSYAISYFEKNPCPNYQKKEGVVSSCPIV